MNYNDFARDIFCKIEKKMSVVAERSVNIIADGCDTHGRYRDCRGTYWWTNGFFGGLNLLLYNETKKECYLKCAESSEMRLDFALENEIDELHHDVGFMWHILSGAKYRLLGDGASRTRNLYAASLLASRFVLGGGFIEAWNGRGAENITIIDTLMNLPLLYWASREISNDRYKRIAMAHADAAIKTHLRPDGSVAHIVEHDRESGEVIRTFGGQGYAEGSAWSRGSAWAIYGFTLSYIHTGEERYLKAAISAADYFISGISQDGTVPVDFKAPLEPKIIDTSAAACAACGMIELGKILKASRGEAYTDAAIRLLSVIDSKYANYETGVDYLLSCGTVSYPTDGDFKKAEVHVPIIYADYFYTEAILKLCGSEFNPW